MSNSEQEYKLAMTEAERRKALETAADYFDSIHRGWIEGGGIEEMAEREHHGQHQPD